VNITQDVLDRLGLRVALFDEQGYRVTRWVRITTTAGADVEVPSGHRVGFWKMTDGQGREHDRGQLNATSAGEVVHVDVTGVDLDAPRLS
jgi:hypothetical protein